MVPPNWTAVSGLFIQGHYFQYPQPDLIWPNPNLQIIICRYFQYLDVYGQIKIARYILYILIPSHPILQRQSTAFFHPWTLQSPARWPRANCWPNAPSLAQRGIFHRGRDLKPRNIGIMEIETIHYTSLYIIILHNLDIQPNLWTLYSVCMYCSWTSNIMN